MLIHIEGTDLPDRARNVHVAVQGKGQQDLLGLTPADVPVAHWEIEAQLVSPSPFDLRGPQIHGSPGHRFLYLTWGVVDKPGSFTMFRRAKLWLDTVPDDVLVRAVAQERLIARLGLSDAAGRPICASVRPPLISWSA